MLKICFFLGTLLLTSLGFAKTFVLVQGEKQKISGHAAAWVENGKIIHLQDQGKFYFIKALKAGASSLRIGSELHQVFVISVDQFKTEKLFKKIIPQTLNLSSDIRGGEVIISGHLVRWQDWLKIHEACLDTNLKCRKKTNSFYIILVVFTPIMAGSCIIILRRK